MSEESLVDTYHRRNPSVEIVPLRWHLFRWENSQGEWQFDYGWRQMPKWALDVLKFASTDKNEPYFMLVVGKSETKARPGMWLVNDPLFGVKLIDEDVLARDYVKRT